jgi:hypothetical protein
LKRYIGIVAHQRRNQLVAFIDQLWVGAPHGAERPGTKSRLIAWWWRIVVNRFYINMKTLRKKWATCCLLYVT